MTSSAQMQIKAFPGLSVCLAYRHTVTQDRQGGVMVRTEANFGFQRGEAEYMITPTMMRSANVSPIEQAKEDNLKRLANQFSQTI